MPWHTPYDLRHTFATLHLAKGHPITYVSAQLGHSDHFSVALHQAEEFPHQLEQIELKRFYGEMLLERSGKGDKIKARDLLVSAKEGYKRAEMPMHLKITQSLLARTH